MGYAYVMRKLAIIGLALASITAQAVKPGDSRASVIGELGAPMGEIDLGDRVRLMFEAGDVTLVDGVVTEHSLKTPAELKRHNEIRETMAEQAQERAAVVMAERLDKGRTWLDYLELDSTPLTDQDIKSLIAFWKNLRKDYPSVDIDAEYEATLALAKERAEEIKQRAEEQRMAQLEQRVAAAEQRAAAAEQQAAQARYDAQYTSYYPAYYYPQPRSVVIIRDGVVCKPNKPIIPCNTGNGGGLQANYSSGNFSVSFNSRRLSDIGPNVPYTPSRPIVITQTSTTTD